MLGVIEVIALLLIVPYLALNLAASTGNRQRVNNWSQRMAGRVRAFLAKLPAGLRFPMVLIGAVLGLAFIGASAPLLVLLLAVVALVVFASHWLQEFRFLMLLQDDAFPGRNDKLIWALLLFLLPPAGVWLFRSYREVHWPATKASGPEVGNELF
ncbi:MAG TPA: hypothetical protein VGY53_09020 [Isosphaeraceae bacterium]|nr:hypothetical protein [Isosphaeraceae bacterium]